VFTYKNVTFKTIKTDTVLKCVTFVIPVNCLYKNCSSKVGLYTNLCVRGRQA